MARTDLERYDETLKYLYGVHAGLAMEVDQLVSQEDMMKGQFGKRLSLKGIWSKGHLYRSQHTAMRALLLCQSLYLYPPWARKAKYTRSDDGHGGFSSTRDGYKDFYTAGQVNVSTSIIRNMSENDIKKRILCYVPIGGAGRDDVATAAEAAVAEGSIDHGTLSREDPLLFKNAICFDAVSLWLFKSGFVSIRWLTREGPSLQADTANDMLGLGTVINADALDRMPRGYLFNFHAGNAGGRDNKDVCHWGVSLGNGMGAAANTTPEEKPAEGEALKVKFRLGNSRYGTFRMKESYAVCQLKYGKERKDADTIIRQIDPTLVAGYY